MSFVAKLQHARDVLAQQGRLSMRAFARELDLAGDDLDEIVSELIDVQGVARREGDVIVSTTGAGREWSMLVDGYQAWPATC